MGRIVRYWGVELNIGEVRIMKDLVNEEGKRVDLILNGNIRLSDI